MSGHRKSARENLATAHISLMGSPSNSLLCYLCNEWKNCSDSKPTQTQVRESTNAPSFSLYRTLLRVDTREWKKSINGINKTQLFPSHSHFFLPGILSTQVICDNDGITHTNFPNAFPFYRLEYIPRKKKMLTKNKSNICYKKPFEKEMAVAFAVLLSFTAAQLSKIQFANRNTNYMNIDAYMEKTRKKLSHSRKNPDSKSNWNWNSWCRRINSRDVDSMIFGIEQGTECDVYVFAFLLPFMLPFVHT